MPRSAAYPALLAASLTAALALAACGSAPAPVTVRGALDLSSASGWTETAGQTCDYGSTPAQMILTSSSGATLATATLSAGTLVNPSVCSLPFRFAAVPAGSAAYGVRLAGHGTVWYTARQVTKPVTLTLDTG
jgi:hypothetical protein